MSIWLLCALMIRVFFLLDRAWNNVCMLYEIFASYLYLSLFNIVCINIWLWIQCAFFPSGSLLLFRTFFPDLDELGSFYFIQSIFAPSLHIEQVNQSTSCYGSQLRLTFLFYTEASISVVQILTVVSLAFCWTFFKDI